MIMLLCLLSCQKSTTEDSSPQDSVPQDSNAEHTGSDCPDFETNSWLEEHLNANCNYLYTCNPEGWVEDWDVPASGACQDFFRPYVTVADECLALDCNASLWDVTDDCSLGWPEVCDQALGTSSR
jgi:hypothetical protein